MADGQIFHEYNLSFRRNLKAAVDSTTERPIQLLWDNVLNTFFFTPPQRGRFPETSFVIESKTAALQTGHEADCIVVEVRYVGSSTNFPERQIFFVECKKNGEDTSAGWRQAETQLAQYCQLNLNHACTSLYAAVGIGTKVLFYKWEESDGSPMNQMSPMHQGTLNFSIPADRPRIEAFLDHIKTTGWDRSFGR